jgi:glycosyltransferase involved in cell wall biosynthesis
VRFLFVSNFLPKADSGSAGSLMSLAGALGERGHVVDFLWRSELGPRLPHNVADDLLLLPRRQLREVRRRLSGKARYDVVMVSQPYAFRVYEELIPAYPNVLFVNRTHGWEERRRRQLASLDSKARSVRRRPSRHASSWMRAQMCARTARAAHGIVAPCRLCAEFIVAEYPLDPRNVRVIPYGVDADSGAEAARRAERPGTSLRFLFAGVYTDIKGAQLLEQVLPRLAEHEPDVALTCVVPDEAQERVLSAYGGTFGERLTVRPWMSREAVREVYREHDVFLFPSLFEGYGKAAVEAMREGMCVVGSDEGVLHELGPSGAALTFPAADSAAFQRLLRECIGDRQLVERVARAGNQAVRELTWSRTAELTEAWCLELRDRLRIEA